MRSQDFRDPEPRARMSLRRRSSASSQRTRPIPNRLSGTGQSSGVQSEAPQTRVQSAAAQSQRSGGSGLDALSFPQRIDNGALFDLCERRRRAQRTVGCVPRYGSPQWARGEDEMGGRNAGSLGEDERALDRVLQLAHVARPVVSEEDVARLAGQGSDGPSHPVGEGPQKMIGQEEHVLIPLPQRRKMQAEDG